MNLDRLANFATVLIAGCAVIITGLVVRQELSLPTPTTAEPRPVEDWEQLAATGHRLGVEDGALTIVEFSDFQCPFCARVQGALQALQERHPGEVTVVFRHFPLESIHPHARAAANAAECAAEQGRFQELHDALFAAQDGIGVTTFEQFAHQAGVKHAQAFSTCLDERRYDRRVTADARAARAAGLDGTPSLIVNGILLPGTPSAAELALWADSLLAHPAHSVTSSNAARQSIALRP